MRENKKVEKKKTINNQKNNGVSNKRRGRPSKTAKQTNNKKNINNDNMDKKEIEEKIELMTLDIDNIIKSSSKNKKDEETILEISDKEGAFNKPKEIEWLQEQIDGLTKINTEYENKYIKLKEEYDLLLDKVNKNTNNNFNSKDISNIKRGVIEIYTELLNNYTGKNSTNKRWTTVKIEYLLNKFKSKFNFI